MQLSVIPKAKCKDYLNNYIKYIKPKKKVLHMSSIKFLSFEK